MEGSGQWAEKQAQRPPTASTEQVNFYRRTRPTKDSGELSSPKKPGETFSKAKEQHHSPKKTESQEQEATLSRSRMSQTRATQSTSPRKSTHGGQRAASNVQQAGHHQGPLRRLKDSSTLDHKKKNGKAGNADNTQGREMEARGDGSRPDSKRRDESRGRGPGKDSGRRRTTGTSASAEEKESLNKRESLPSFKDLWSRKGSVVSPREGKEREGGLPHSDRSSGDFVASADSIPGPPQSPKGPISPKPWKIPSSVKILTLPEALRDPL